MILIVGMAIRRWSGLPYQGNIDVVTFLLAHGDYTSEQIASAKQNAMENTQEEVVALLGNS